MDLDREDVHMIMMEYIHVQSIHNLFTPWAFMDYTINNTILDYSTLTE